MYKTARVRPTRINLITSLPHTYTPPATLWCPMLTHHVLSIWLRNLSKSPSVRMASQPVEHTSYICKLSTKQIIAHLNRKSLITSQDAHGGVRKTGYALLMQKISMKAQNATCAYCLPTSRCVLLSLVYVHVMRCDNQQKSHRMPLSYGILIVQKIPRLFTHRLASEKS